MAGKQTGFLAIPDGRAEARSAATPHPAFGTTERMRLDQLTTVRELVAARASVLPRPDRQRRDGRARRYLSRSSRPLYPRLTFSRLPFVSSTR